MDRAKLVAQLVRHEGERLKPYVDTVGKVTIGVGHNLTDLGITQAQSRAILADDIDTVLKWVQRDFSWFASLDEVRQRVILDMAFNMGPARLHGFKSFLAAVAVGDWVRAAEEMLDSVWARQVGARADTLARMMKTGTD